MQCLIFLLLLTTSPQAWYLRARVKVRRHDAQLKDTQHNDIQHINIQNAKLSNMIFNTMSFSLTTLSIQHNNEQNVTLSILTLSTVTLNIIAEHCNAVCHLCWVSFMLSVTYAECHSYWVSHTSPLCWVSLYWMSLCWVKLCWVSGHQTWTHLQDYKNYAWLKTFYSLNLNYSFISLFEYHYYSPTFVNKTSHFSN